MTKPKLIAAVIVLAAIGGWVVFGKFNPYYGLVTEMEVQSTPEVISQLEQQKATALASIQASIEAGERPDLNMYELAAQAAYYLGDLVSAREIYEEYFTENAINPSAWNTYGNILVRMEDWQSAEVAYKTALALAPAEEYYRDLIKVIARNQERAPEVEVLLLNYIDTLGRTQWVMVSLGDWYAQQGQCEKAIDHYKVALSIARDAGGDITPIEQDIESVEQNCVEQ